MRAKRALFAVAAILAAGPSFADDRAAIEAGLRRDTQALLDAIAPGAVKVWDRLLDPGAIQVDENDVVRDKKQMLAELQPLGPGLQGHLNIDDFRVALFGDVAVVTHEDAEYLDYHGQVLRSRFRMTDTWRKTADGWRQIASQVLAVQQDPPAIQLGPAALCVYSGRYALTADIVATVACKDGHLAVIRPGKSERIFLAETPDVFFEPGQPRTRRIFQRGPDGTITGFADRREERDIVWKRIGDAAN
ncbi:MAG TPA: nuclear transport factor 2 family protein [Alphaproteobacteria bacterium]|nr:nuclear transport factor 2 family protein [Alphaproteobacteria bacterium]